MEERAVLAVVSSIFWNLPAFTHFFTFQTCCWYQQELFLGEYWINREKVTGVASARIAKKWHSQVGWFQSVGWLS
jgi:hypothetical protein